MPTRSAKTVRDTNDLDVHSIIPLSVLEAMRVQDVPSPDDLGELGEYHIELATKRLGMSRTVATQIERYSRLAGRNRRVDRAEAVALLALAGRRSDGALLFADAGRRAGNLAAQRVSPTVRGLWRALPRFARNRLGFVLTRRLVRRTFGMEITREGGRVTATVPRPLSIEATPDGAACALLGSAVAAVLRAFTDFEGAVVHEACLGRGADACRWETATAARGRT